MSSEDLRSPGLQNDFILVYFKDFSKQRDTFLRFLRELLRESAEEKENERLHIVVRTA